MRLAGLVVEERPRVVGGLRELGRDDAGAELLEPVDVLLRRAVLRQCRAADRRWPGEDADREPAQPRLGHGRSCEHRPRERDLLDGAGHRADGVEGGAEREHAVERDAPQLGFSPTSPQQAAGRRIEQPVSVARPRSQRPAASAAALPPDEPPVVLPGCAGFCTVPYQGFWLVTPQANSCRFALPTMTAPAATRRSTAGAVRVGT